MNNCNWTTQPLGKVIEYIKTGSTPSTSNSEFFNGSIPWFTPSDIGNSKDLSISSRYITEKALLDGKSKLLKQDTLLVTCIGDIGRVGILKRDSSFNQQITGLNFSNEIDVEYAYFWFIYHRRKLQHLASQAIVPILNNERLLELDFLYPSIKEQKRIAQIASKCDRLRRTRRYTQQLSDTYLRSVFLEMFGDSTTNSQNWESVTLEENCDVQGGIQLSQKREDLKLKKPYLRVANVYRNQLNLSEIKLIGLTENEFQRVRLQSGDILIVEGHGNANEIGRCATWDGSIDDCVHQNHLIRVRPNLNELNSVFLSFYINTAGQEYFHAASNTTSGLNTISTGIVKRCSVPIPPIQLQEKFARIVQKYDRIRNQQREAARQAEHLFQTTLHRAFRGEL